MSGTFTYLPPSGGGVDTVATAGDLPAAGASGDLYLILDSGRLMWWDVVAGAWDEIDADISPYSVSDSTSVDLTVTAGMISADLKISGTAAASGFTKASTSVKSTGSYGLHVEMENASAAVSGPLASGDFQTFAAKQPGDATLTALAALDSTAGYLAQTAADTFAKRTLTGTANRLSVSNGDGTSAAPVFNVDATQFPSSVTADTGKTLVAGVANAAAWGVGAATIDLGHSGLVSWGGSGNYYSLSSGTFSVLRAGVGRLSGSKITWAGGENVTGLAADKTYYIGYNASNTLVKIDAATIYSASPETYYENMHDMFADNVILFTVWMDSVTPIVAHEDHPYEYATDISVHDHFRLGQVFTGTGADLRVLTPASATIQSVGEDRLDDHGLSSKVPDLTGSIVDVTPVFKDAAGRAKRYNRRVFTVSGVSVTPTYPATYTNNGSTFTVLHTSIAAGSGTIICWTSAGTALPEASGNLTKTSGTGDATIAFSAYASPTGCSSTYISGNVPTPLGTGGANRYGIWAVYIVKGDLQTPSTANPIPNYIWVPSNVAYNSTANAATSLGAGSAPIMTQFLQSEDLLALEPSLNGFVLMDGNGRAIPAYTGNGFIAGVRTFKQTGSTQFSAGAVATAAAVNVSTVTTAFVGWLTSADTNVQLALDSIAAKSAAIRTVTTGPTITLADRTILCDATAAPITVNLPAAASNLGRMMWIKKTDVSANAVIIDGNSGETIDGASTQTISSVGKCVQIQCDGSNWYILSTLWG